MPSEMLKLFGTAHDLGGGMSVTRLYAQVKKRMVGPFAFFDHLGPVDILAGQNTDVRPHPHIGLSTLTYMLEGRMVHRDSLGSEVTIVPGDVNWMTAGNGISHSERAHRDDKNMDHRLQGLQFWIALPDELEDVVPSFMHYDRSDIPRKETPTYDLSVVAGAAFGLESPVKVSSPLILAEVKAKPAPGSIAVGFQSFEVAVYVIQGQLQISGQNLVQNDILILPPATNTQINFDGASHCIIFGGTPFLSERFIWWNMVSSSWEKIEMAKYRWKNGSFPMVPGETELIPAPD